MVQEDYETQSPCCTYYLITESGKGQWVLSYGFCPNKYLFSLLKQCQYLRLYGLGPPDGDHPQDVHPVNHLRVLSRPGAKHSPDSYNRGGREGGYFGGQSEGTIG